MTSYFRYFFGGNQPKNLDQPMPHPRSGPTPNYFYGPPAGSPSRLKSKRSNSFSATSPLRYNSLAPAAGEMKQGTPLKSRKTPLYRRASASYKSSEHLGNYPVHTPRGPPVSFGERRSSVRQNQPWQNSISSATESGHSYTANGMDYGARAPLHMHPLFAATRLHSAPINYDVTYAPSTQTVVDRATNSPIPAHTLSQPATDPPTPATSRIVLRSDKFPWPVIVGPNLSSGSPAKSGRLPHITNLDLLHAAYLTLATRVTPQEWEALGHGSRAQRKVTRAYESRCTKLGGGWEGGVRRIDWLHGKTRLIGIEVEKYGSAVGSGKLIFGKG